MDFLPPIFERILLEIDLNGLPYSTHSILIPGKSAGIIIADEVYKPKLRLVFVYIAVNDSLVLTHCILEHSF